MSGNRTEPPTPRRLREARRRGEVAQSRELSGAAALAAGLAALAALSPWATAALKRFLHTAVTAAAGEPAPLAALGDALAAWTAASLPPCAAAFLAAAAASRLQAGALFSPDALRPRWDRLDPLRGLRRLCSPRQLGQVALRAVQTAALLLLSFRRLREASGILSQLPRLSPLAATSAMGPVLQGLACELCLALLGFGLLDLSLQRRRHRRSLMMTPEEVRRDLKEEEGDPRRKAERERLCRAAVWAGPVSRATCVVVNPTHLAVALAHDRQGDEPPRVLAKGAGAAAERIRAAARRAGVPVIREAPLARALYRLAEVGEFIPEELYRAAAAVLGHVYGLAAGEVRP